MRPRKKAASAKKINVLDLGFGDAQRLIPLAENHKNKTFMGIELKEQQLDILRLRKTKNLNLVLGHALTELKRLPPKSVKIITADFFFTGFLQSKWASSEDRNTPAQKKAEKQVAKQVRRVLTPNGRFVLIEYNGRIQYITKILDESGFRYTIKPLPASKIEKTEHLKINKERIQKYPSKKEQLTPMRIVAIKK